jgi:signal transduction histidine kinase
MISDIIRTMKKSEARLERFMPQRLCISEMVSELSGKYETWLASLHIRFYSQVQPDVYVECDSLQLEMVLHNFMQNACKHTKPGKEIRLSLRSEGNTCYIGVHNEGSGIPETEMGEIWKRYYRGSNEADGQGSGLGLYIVRDIIKRHQGNCGVFNDDSGVEFYCILPLQLAKEKEH